MTVQLLLLRLQSLQRCRSSFLPLTCGRCVRIQLRAQPFQRATSAACWPMYRATRCSRTRMHCIISPVQLRHLLDQRCDVTRLQVQAEAAWPLLPRLYLKQLTSFFTMVRQAPAAVASCMPPPPPFTRSRLVQPRQFMQARIERGGGGGTSQVDAAESSK